MQHSDISVDAAYLTQEQYKDASSFNERIRIMRDLGIDFFAWYEQIFNLLALAPGQRILELGCGPGHLWQKHVDRLPLTSEITLSDFSPGMLSAAQQTLKGNPHFRFQIIDAQAIPFADAHFNVVIANLMLYHVPDRARAISEIARVLKPQGHFYAATFSQNLWPTHLSTLIHEAGIDSWMMGELGFSVENGTEQLAPSFSQVTLHHLKNTMTLTGAKPIVDFIRTGTARANWDETKFHHLHQLIEQSIARHEPISITQKIGLFDARR